MSQTRHFLQTLGLVRRKIGALPSKADPVKQEVFLKEKLEPRLKEAVNGNREVYFMDAAHFVLAPFLGFLWSIKRIFIPAPSGRRRFNVLGALHAITHELVTVTNDTYINAQQALPVKILKSVIDSLIVPDGAAGAPGKNIEIVYL